MKKNILPFVLLISISLLACIIVFASLDGQISGINVLQNFVWNLPICLLIGYIDYKIISYSHKRNNSFNVWTILTDIVISNLLLSILSAIYIYAESLLRDTEIYFLQRIILSTFCNSVIILIVEVFFYNQRLLENKAYLATTEKEKAQYQFEALKNQINPHFLFNSLNVLSSLAYQDAEKANLFAKKLSSVYRYLLATQNQMKVTLQEELDFVESYIYLERIRFGESLYINIVCKEDTAARHIVPVSIQMLVENALKHNTNTIKSPLMVAINIENGFVTVSNNLQLRNSVSKNRIGLSNLEKQYGIHGKHITIEKTDTTFSVKLPLL